MRTGAVGDEELTAVRSFALVRHRHDSSRIMTIWPLKLVFEILPPAARAPASRTRWITPLEHEIPDVPMENDVFVVAFLGQLHEIPDGFGGEFGEEFEVEDAVGGEYAGVAGGLDAARFEHVFFVGEEGEVAGCVGG